MQVVHERCSGLDDHKKTVVACVLTTERREVRTFGTMTRELLRLADWLGEERVTHLAMESTGVYWKPVYNLLEDQGIELMVVNAQHIKTVPGQDQLAAQERRAAAGARGVGQHASARHARAPAPPRRVSGAGDPGVERRDRGADAPFRRRHRPH